MRCSKAKKLIVQRVDGALGDAAGTRLERHLAGCPDCRKYHEEVAKLVQSLRAAPEPQKSDAFWGSFSESVRRRIKQEETTRAYRPAIPARRPPLLRPALVLVPALFVLVVLAAFFLSRPQAPTTTVSDYDALMTMFEGDSLLNLPASETALETSADYSDYYDDVDLPAGFFNGGQGLFRGATPSDMIDDMTDTELENLYRTLVET